MSRGGLGLRSYPQPDLDNTSVGNGVCPYKERTVKRIIISALVLVSAVAAFAQPAREENVLTVYSYDSFSGEWGPAGTLIPAFEEKTGIKVNLVGAGDAVQMLSRLELEGDSTPADGNPGREKRAGICRGRQLRRRSDGRQTCICRCFGGS